jgi:hypothetical protein
LGLENLKSVFGEIKKPSLSNVGNRHSQPTHQSEHSQLDNGVSSFSPKSIESNFLGPSNSFIESAFTSIQDVMTPRVSVGVGEVFPLSATKMKIRLAKYGNAASIYYLGSGKENYSNWGGWTKHGDTLAITGQLTNFGPLEDFLNNSLGITVPDIPLLGPQFTFYKPIKYTDTVFELRGSDATDKVKSGLYHNDMKDLRGVAMQSMLDNRLGKTVYLNGGKSFVKFTNNQRGSAANDVADFLVDTAGDIGGGILDLASDAGSSIASGVSGLVSSISVSIPKPNLPTLPSPITFIKGLKAPDLSSIFDVDFPKLSMPSVDLPSLKSMGDGLGKFISKAGDLLPNIPLPNIDLPDVNLPTFGGIGGRASAFGSKLAGLIPDIPISFPKISLKPSSELLDFINDIKNGTSAFAKREARESIEFLSRVGNVTARTFRSAKDRTQRFVEEVQDKTAHNYQDLEKKLKSATSPRIPGYGEGGGSVLAMKNPRELQNQDIPNLPSYSQFGTDSIKYSNRVKDEKSLGDPVEGQSLSNPSLLSNKHIEGDSGNIWSGINKQNGDDYQQKLNEEDPLGGDLVTPIDRSPESIATKQLEELITPYSGLDINYEKYSSNVKTKHRHKTDDNDTSVAGEFYQSSVGNTTDVSDLHTALPQKTGASLSNAGEDYKKDAESEKYGMPFYFKDLRDGKYVIFRGYIEGITENFSPSWNSHNYIGRSESVWTYSRTDRGVNFTFKVFAGSDKELQLIYEKINTLSSMVYPWYHKDAGLGGKNRMKPPYTSLRLGELFGNEKHNMTGFIKSLDYSWPDNSPWETERGKRVPKHIVVTVGFQVVHRDPPDKDTPATHFHGYLAN